MEGTNINDNDERYRAGQVAANVQNLQKDITEIKANVQKLVDKQWALEVRVYMFAGIVAALVAKGTTLLASVFGP